MPRRIEEDHKDFRDVYEGRIRKELKKFINNGTIFRHRGKNGKIAITIPRIDIPHIVFGNENEGIGRGPGKPGDVIDKDDEGEGKGPKAGEGHQDGVTIQIDMEEILKFLKEELKLPNLKPKPNQTYEEDEIKYNNIALTGPEALRHNRRTMLQALKRACATGDIFNLEQPPGFAQPIRMVKPINSDRRYRQYRIIKKPSSNAVIFFARDGSGSMDQYKCDIVSDMAWWIDLWIRHFYNRVERCYVWHDTEAQEVDENKFYRYRYGGGTTCSSALKFVEKQFKNRFPPEKWNSYLFYFSDGENWGDDNKVFCNVIEQQLQPLMNFIGVTQVMAYAHDGSLKHYVDTHLTLDMLRTTSIGPKSETDSGGYISHYGLQLSDEERNKQIRDSIIDLLGAERNRTNSAPAATAANP